MGNHCLLDIEFLAELRRQQKWTVVTVNQHCECTYYLWIKHLKTVKIVNFTLWIFYHNFLKVLKEKKPANLEVYIQQKMSFQSKSKLRIFFFFQIMKTEKIFHYHIYHITRKALAFQAEGNDARKKFKSTYRKEISNYMWKCKKNLRKTFWKLKNKNLQIMPPKGN